MRFIDRAEAGKQLAKPLKNYQGKDVVVYAIPRGGVAVAAEIAKILKAPLDLVIVRKVGHPNNPEYAVCVVTDNHLVVCDAQQASQIDERQLRALIEAERVEAKRRHAAYLNGRLPISSKGKIAILVDDGIATGLTFTTALRELQARGPKKIIAAVPVLPKDVAKEIEDEGIKLVALEIPDYFRGAVGAYYENFSQLTDEEVTKLLEEAKRA